MYKTSACDGSVIFPLSDTCVFIYFASFLPRVENKIFSRPMKGDSNAIETMNAIPYDTIRLPRKM